MNFDNKAIYIPSRGRPARQFTWERFPKRWQAITTIVVPNGERSAYRASNPRAKILQTPESIDTIGKTRQYIIDTTDAEYIMMFDDDMYFYHRIAPMGIKLATNELDDTDKMLSILFGWLEEKHFTHVGLAARPESSFYLCRYRECTRANNVHGFDVRKMRKHGKKLGARFDRMTVMEDFLVTLTLFKAGIPNRVLLDYVWNQPGSNSDGGCSTYRTAEVQAKAAHRLAKMFPEYVKVVEKKVIGATSWEGMKTRTDVQIQWRKAFVDSGKVRKNWKHELASQRQKILGAKA